MCGRLNIVDDPLADLVSTALGIRFFSESNTNLSPTERVSVIGKQGDSLQQLELVWGIKPDWATRIIINAQAETVGTKPTFRSAFSHSRVIVPCSGWYEWKGDKVNKQKYLFSDIEGMPIYMAGIALDSGQRLVTLTTKPNSQCAAFHHRMPLLLSESNVESWLLGSLDFAGDLLHEPYQKELKITTKSSLPQQGSLI